VGADTELDFTSLLDELLAASQEAESRDGGASPSLRVDMLAQIERLQAENLALFPDRAIDAYEESAEGAPRPTSKAEPKETPAHLQPALEDLFFLDPESISRELGIKPKSKPEDLDRARRTFAMRYHPDRVPEEHRERAVLRMQIANMLIDQAKRNRR
jgi:hypothetical protein